jgi:hypothetical protein
LTAAILPAAASVKSKSRNKIDNIEIRKITPRTFSHLLKPVNMPMHMELGYELKSEEKGKIIVKVFKYSGKGKMKGTLTEAKNFIKTVEVKKGKSSTYVITPFFVLPENDDCVEIFVVASLVGSKGQELAFSSSKNFISGSFKVFPGKDKPTRDFVRRIGIQPRINTDIETNATTNFNIILNYSVMSRQQAYVELIFQDMADIGTNKGAWRIATVSLPKGTGKVSLQPSLFFENDLAGRNMGISILLWTNPLERSQDALKISEYFLKKKK